MNVTIDARELLGATKFITTKTKEAMLFKSVMVRADKDNTVIVCTDSVRLVEFSRKTIDCIEPGEVIISAEFIKKNVKKSDCLVAIESDGTNVTLTFYDAKGKVSRTAYTQAVKVERYPLYEKLFSKIKSDEPATSMTVSAAFLADACNALTIAYGDNVGMKITYNNASQPLYITSEDSDGGKCRMLVMPVKEDYWDKDGK